MARPERKDADYFPFYAKDGRTLFLLESKYKCKGTGFFTNVMRFLTLETDHQVSLQDESDRAYFFAKCHCDEESGADMLNIMSKTGKINKELWDIKVIASQDHLDSLTDAYRNRKNNIITMSEIKEKYVSDARNPTEPDVSCAGNSQEPDVSDADNPQRKGKERKGKKKKGDIDYPDWLDLDLWKEFKKYRTAIKAHLGDHAEKLAITELEKLIGEGFLQVDIVNATIMSGSWKSFYPPKQKFRPKQSPLKADILEKGHDVLTNKGEGHFEEYCFEHKLSNEDIDLIRNRNTFDFSKMPQIGESIAKC